MFRVRVALLLIAVLVAGIGVATPAAEAGGSWLAPVQDRYEPGDKATMVGYTGGGSYGTTADGPFYAYLYKLASVDEGPRAGSIPMFVGELETLRTGDIGYTAIRVAVTFDLPDYLEPGVYWIDYCNIGCEQKLGDLIAGYLFVGDDAEYPVTRNWPRSEPEIANLDGDSVVSGPGWELTARAILDAGHDPLELPAISAATQRDLDERYRLCVVERGGIDLGIAVQVLVDDDGRPMWVKTGVNVDVEFHSPCFELIGGDPTDRPSWG